MYEGVLLLLLEKANLKLAVAESLTAGKVSDLIASQSGISKYYQGSVTAYTCDIKHNVLGVDKEWLDKNGPYNKETVEQMCDGVMKLMNADVAVATSGVAGPGDDGDVKEGTIYICVKVKDKYYHMDYRSMYMNNREEIRKQAAEMATGKLVNALVEYVKEIGKF